MCALPAAIIPPLSTVERQERLWPLLRRLLGSVRLLFATLFQAETVRERYGLLTSANPHYGLHDLARILSEDISDVVKSFDGQGPPQISRRNTGNVSLLEKNWEERQSELSFLREQPPSRAELLDIFATIHDTQVGRLGIQVFYSRGA
jgi:hypothetical protein